jgi:hypothetical protein
VELRGCDGLGGGAQRPVSRVNEPRKTGARSTAKTHKIQRLNVRVHLWRGWKLRGKDGGRAKLAENLQEALKQNWRTYISYCPVTTYILAENPQGAPFYITQPLPLHILNCNCFKCAN